MWSEFYLCVQICFCRGERDGGEARGGGGGGGGGGVGLFNMLFGAKFNGRKYLRLYGITMEAVPLKVIILYSGNFCEGFKKIKIRQ